MSYRVSEELWHMNHPVSCVRCSVMINLRYSVWTMDMYWMGYYCRKCIRGISATYDHYFEATGSLYNVTYHDYELVRLLSFCTESRLQKI